MTSKWFELGMMDSILHQNEVLNSQVPQVFGGGPPGRLSGEGPKMTGKLFFIKIRDSSKKSRMSKLGTVVYGST